ncbi:MAG: hypothetical protein KF734_04380 [Saprospiraceae bacterium]|nr:hypothetical protein [Saprospiraceae bacterium]
MQIFVGAVTQKALAQCDCADYGMSVTLSQRELLPFCDELEMNVSIDNIDTEDCEADLVIRVSFGTNSESPINETLLGITYLGNLPLLAEDTWTLVGQIFFRRFFFLASDIPASSSVNSLLRFSLNPDLYFLDPVYNVHVDVVPQSRECENTFIPEQHTYTDFISTALNLVEPPISGTVTSLISSGRLLSNSGSSSLVEQKTIQGVLEVNENYWFDGTGTSDLARPKLYLGAGTQILVKSGFRLTLTNADIFTCDQLAQGIVVEPGATLVMDGCTVSDSRFGIDAQQGSTISVTNTAFADNYIGARLHMEDTPNRVLINAFAGNSFSTDNGLKAPFAGMPEAVAFRGLCGISVSNYRDFNLWGGNDFKRLANSILSWNSSGNLGNMSFTDMNGNASVYGLEGFGIHLSGRTTRPLFFNINEFWTAMTFDDCKTGIYAFKHALNIENTTMTSVDVGIDVAQCQTKDVVLDGNTITARKYGIRSFLNEPVHPISAIRDNEITITGVGAGVITATGIEMEEGAFGLSLSGWRVTGNAVAMELGGHGINYRNGLAGSIENNAVTNASQANNYTGIRVEGVSYSSITANTITQTLSGGLGVSDAIRSSAGWNNTFQCNCLDNTNVGMQFFDLADFSDAVRGNNFNTHCTGLQLNTGAYIGEQNHTGNLWDLSAIAGNCLGGRNFSNPSLSRFYVENSPALNPEVWPNEGWFFTETGSTYDDCAAACTFPSFIPLRLPESSVPTKLDEAIATDKLFPELFEDETNWKGAFRLYRKMLRHPSIESYATEFADFKAAHDSLSTGRLAYIAEQRSTIFALSAVEDSLLEVYRLAWHDGMADLLTLDSLRQSGDSSTLVSQYDSAVSLTTAAREQYALYLDTLGMARRAKIQSLLTQNAAISTAITPADNHKTVNAIVFGLLLNDSLQTGDLATLEAIAETCPLEGGDAVYEARAIVAHITGASYDDTDLCAVSAERSRAEKHEAPHTEAIVLYPNPTTGQVYWTGTDDQPIRIRAFNALGQQLTEVVSTTGYANLGHLQQGIYHVQLLSLDNAVLATRKLQVIQH